MSEYSKKTEKIAHALYLVTSFFDDKEPLKWRIRTLSTSLVSEEIKDKSSLSKEIISLFSMAKTAGLVSDANYNILIPELSRFVEEIEKPLNLSFLHDVSLREATLPQIAQPKKLDYIKDSVHENKMIDKPTIKEFGAVSVKKNSRQSIIIALLKRKKEVMIKDITPLVNGCSEKTIQRELSAMVQTGILRRVGEKRWSRYSLA